MNGRSRLHALRRESNAQADIMDGMRQRFEGIRDRHKNGTAPRAVSAFQLFQTPEAIASRMVALAEIGQGMTVLEPSAGLGRLLRPILATPAGNVTAADISTDCLAELRREFPEIEVEQGDFLAMGFPRAFDRIVMNPPFHMRADIRHTLHALKFLAPGGKLVGLCMSGPHREEELRPLCKTWEVIPAGAFRAEGTDVETILFSIEP